jgi:ankyrin repeat protein
VKRSTWLLAFAVALSVSTASAAEDWIEEVGRTWMINPERPRRVMLVFPLVEEGSDTGEIGWGRGLIAIQAMWISSFAPDRVLDTYDFGVKGLFGDQQLLGPGRRVTQEKIRAMLAVMDTTNYATGTLDAGGETYTCRLVLHGSGGTETREYTGAHADLHRLPNRIALDVVDYMQVVLTDSQREYMQQPALCSNELFEEVAKRVYAEDYYDAVWLELWEAVLERCESPWVDYSFYWAASKAQEGRLDDYLAGFRPLADSAGLRFQHAQHALNRALENQLPWEEAGAQLVRLMHEDPYVPAITARLARALMRNGQAYQVDNVMRRLGRVHAESILAALWRGAVMVEFAWDARGDNWAPKVTRTGWQLFGDRLERARDELETAIEREPLCWPVAVQLINVATGMGLGRSYVDRSLRLATEACPTGDLAYKVKFHYLRPRWHGSMPELVAFARECAQGERLVRTSLPLLLVDAYLEQVAFAAISGGMPRAWELQETRRIVTRPDVWDELRPVLERCVRADPYCVGALSQYLLFAYWRRDRALVDRLYPMTRDGCFGREWCIGLHSRFPAPLYRAIGALVGAGWPRLHTAAAYGDLADVQKALADGAEPGLAIGDGWTPLHLAALDGHVAVVRALLGAGVAPDARTLDARTPLSIATEFGHDQTARLIAGFGGVEPGAGEDARRMLQAAAMEGNLTYLQQLLDQGVDPDAKGADGVTALMAACAERRAAVARVLLEAGANPDAAGPDGWPPLIKAVEWGDAEVVRLLLECGADPDYPNRLGSTPLGRACLAGRLHTVQALIDAGADVSKRGGYGYRPLHLAARNGDVRIAKLLMLRGADPFAADNDYALLPLHQAAETGALDMVRLFLRMGQPVDAPSEERCTALHRAALAGHAQVVELLLREGADPELPDSEGRRPLHKAAIEGHADTVRALLRHGADPNSHEGCAQGSPVHFATWQGRLVEARLLLDAGADPDLPDGSGQTPVMTAIGGGSLQVVRLLLGRGAGVEARDNRGCNAVHVAAANRRCSMIPLLVEHGAGVSLPDNEGNTPLHVAARLGDLACCQALLAAGADVGAVSAASRTPAAEARENGREDVARFLEGRGGRGR